MAANDLEVQDASWKFARSAYDFGRLRRLLPDQVWTSQEEENLFNKQFETTIRTFSTAVKGMCSIPRAENLYTVKLYLSAFEFIRTDLLQLYEKSRPASATAELLKAMNVLEREQFFLKRQMDEWEFQTDFHHPNQWEKPCLEGIPKEHKWWHLELGIKDDNTTEDDFEFDWTK
ncbi:unnamed protein product [Rotaria sp. Silwood2]|nr:unnamed protein product [Rotaria sp. Silwood2]